MGETIVVGDKKYIIEYDSEGNQYLKTYDEEFKIWVELHFKQHQTNATDRIIEMLSNEYISKVINSKKINSTS